MMYKDKDKFIKLVQKYLDNESGFTESMGFKIIDYVDGKLYGEAPLKEEYLNSNRTGHGGYLATIVDSFAGNACVFAEGPYDSAVQVTMSCNINFLRPALHGPLKVEAFPVKLGKHIKVCQVDIFDAEGYQVLTSISNMYIG